MKLQARGVFLWILRIFEEHLFYGTPLGDCFCSIKITFTKNKPQEIFYREYIFFDFSKFNNELKLVFSDGNIPSYDKIEDLFLEVLNSHATVKKKMLRANFIQLMSKPLRKAIMKRFYKSSRPEVFSKKGVRKSFAKFRAKHLCQNLFFNKVAGLRHITLKKRKKKRLAQEMSCEFCEIFKNTFFTELFRWLLLVPP